MSTTTNGHTSDPAPIPVPAPAPTQPSASDEVPSFLPPPHATKDQLDAWRQSLHDHYKHSSPLARFLLDRLIDMAAALHKLSANTDEDRIHDAQWARHVRSIETSFTRALTDWQRHCRFLQQSDRDAQRAASPSTPRKRAAAAQSSADDDPSTPTPESARSPFDKEGDITIDTATPITWEDHIVYDPTVSYRWPVIKGTRHQAHGIASMIGYGWSFRYLLEHFDGITVDDLRALIAADAIQMCGPWPEGERPEPCARPATRPGEESSFDTRARLNCY